MVNTALCTSEIKDLKWYNPFSWVSFYFLFTPDFILSLVAEIISLRHSVRQLNRIKKLEQISVTMSRADVKVFIGAVEKLLEETEQKEHLEHSIVLFPQKNKIRATVDVRAYGEFLEKNINNKRNE
jgi:hypothetical protein